MKSTILHKLVCKISSISSDTENVLGRQRKWGIEKAVSSASVRKLLPWEVASAGFGGQALISDFSKLESSVWSVT